MYKDEIYSELNKLSLKNLVKSDLYNSLSMEQRFKYFVATKKLFLAVVATVLLLAAYLAIPSFDNELEKSLILGKSTRKDFNKYKENGGLQSDKDVTWKGYRVESVNLQYDDKGKLGSFQIILSKLGYGDKSATVTSVKSTLSGYCPNNWEPGASDTYWAKKNNKTICAIDASGSTIGIDVNSY